MSERIKNGHLDGLRLSEGDGIRKIGILEKTNGQGQKSRTIQYAVASAVGAAVTLVTQEGKGDTFADFVASYQPENLRELSEVNTGLSNTRCSITPSGNLRWRRGDGGTLGIFEAPIRINSDGTLSIVSPPVAIYGPDGGGYRNSFLTSSGNEFLEISTSVLERNGIIILDRRMAVDGFNFGDVTPFEEGIAISANRGRTRSGTQDVADISLFAENYTGPPMPIITQADFLANTRFSGLNRDPVDRAEVYEEVRVVQSDIHAFVTRRCRRVLGNCTTANTENTWDIFMDEWNPVLIDWDTGTETMAASTMAGQERGSCVIHNDQAECLIVEKTIGGREQLHYACHRKDTDGDTIINFFDNCPINANADQSNLDGDSTGDACDPCPRDATNDASDVDGICDDIDNCVGVSNADQSDRDLDDIGDVCDACLDDRDNDVDRDGVCGNIDNCPTISNADQLNTYGDSRGDACEPPPVVDAGIEGGIDAGMEGGVDAGVDGSDSGTDAGTDGNSEAGTDASIDADVDAGRDVVNDVGDESTDAGIDDDSSNDVVDENSDAHDGGKTEISIPPRKGCSCDIPQGSVGSLDAFQISLVAVAVIQGIRRKIFGKKKVNAKQ